MPERYESKISSLEETKDLSSISLVELVNSLQAQEQRQMMRGEASIEGVLHVKGKNHGGGNNNRQNEDIFQPCANCKKANHPQIRCWWRPDVKCIKCGNMGHVERVCRSKSDEAKISMMQQEDLLFIAECFATSNSSCD